MATRLRQQIKELKKERNRYRSGYGLLMDCWHEFCDDTQIHLDKKLKRLDI